MLFRKSTEYAIRLVLFLYQNGSDKYIRIREISDVCDISYFKLGKVSQTLLKSGILDTYTGPNGGIKLSRKASDIRLIDIVGAMGEDDILDKCVLGIGPCDEENPCALHNQMKDVKKTIMTMYRKKTIDQLFDFEFESTLEPK